MSLLPSALPTPNPDLAHHTRNPRITDGVVEALAAGRKARRGAANALSTWFRKARRFGSKERPVVQAAVYGIIRNEHLFVRAGARSPEDLVEHWARALDGDRFETVESTTPAEDFATALSIDYLIAREWLEELGVDEASLFARAQAQEAPTVLRAQAHLCSREELQERLAEEGVQTQVEPTTPWALIAERRVPWGGLASFKEGWFEVQDTSSQALVDALALRPGERVLDLCAGAGGKALAMAALGAEVQACDVRDKALHELEKRALRANLAIEGGEARPAPTVLVDAPCSGTGRLRRNPALRWGLEAGAWVATQQALLEEAAALTEPGGRLVYATCSLLSEENHHALPGWRVDSQRTLWPHRDGTDGFSWRVFVRED